jgi:hypothetical protein
MNGRTFGQRKEAVVGKIFRARQRKEMRRGPTMIFLGECGVAAQSGIAASQMIRRYGELWKALPPEVRASYPAKASPQQWHRPRIYRYLSESDDDW